MILTMVVLSVIIIVLSAVLGSVLKKLKHYKNCCYLLEKGWRLHDKSGLPSDWEFWRIGEPRRSLKFAVRRQKMLDKGLKLPAEDSPLQEIALEDRYQAGQWKS